MRAYKRGGLYSGGWGELKKGSRNKLHSSADQNQPHLQSQGKRPGDEVGSKFLFEQIKFTSMQARGGAYIREGGYNWMYFFVCR